MNAKTAALVGVVAILVVGTIYIGVEQGVLVGPPALSTTTTVSTGASSTGSADGLQLRLSVNASNAESSAGGLTFHIMASEYNTLTSSNNVTAATNWKLSGLSLGACGTDSYPFGVALYRGSYTAGNVSGAQQVQIYPVVPCPLLVRYITGYLFQPTSDLAVVLPGGPNATAIPMSVEVNATGEYGVGASVSSSSTPLGPGTFTFVAGDQWGAVVVTQVTIKSTSTSTSSTGSSLGTLDASFSIGPTQPVCSASATTGPASSPYTSVDAVVTTQSSGQTSTLPISWQSDGCSVSGSLQTNLAPGSYTLNLSSCQWLGCSSALPKTFQVVAGQTTSVNVSIDTGIR